MLGENTELSVGGSASSSGVDKNCPSEDNLSLKKTLKFIFCHFKNAKACLV